MAPPMKELPRWLLENPEFSIAPDWTDIVKQSVSYQDKIYALIEFLQTYQLKYFLYIPIYLNYLSL